MTDPHKTQMLEEDPNRTRITSAPSLAATQTIQPIQCPVCKSHNPPGVLYCVECGLVLSTSGSLPDDVFSAPPVRPPSLVDSAGREQHLRPGENLVGREGDILLTDSRCSRKHAKVYLEGGKVFVEDLGSTNGTTVNGQPLQANTRVEIKQGDTVAFAGVEMTLHFPGEAGATQLPQSNKTAMLDTSPSVERPIAYLVGDGERHALREGANTIGRKPDNHIVIPDPYVSGAHGVLEIENDSAHYTDTGSTNGSFLNGARLEPQQRATLKPGDVLKLGQKEFTIEWSREEGT
jgi:pSer/pThr/pTyr-binding forkhead associated (FHA) protein